MKKRVEDYKNSRDSSANKLLNQLKWYHYVIAGLVIIGLIYYSYSDVIKSKFTADEKSLIFNSLTYFNVTNQTTSIMPKVNLAGHFNPTPILILTLAFILVIAWILMKKKEIALDYGMILDIVEYNLNSRMGVGKQFPNGTRFVVGPSAKEMDIRNLGLGEFIKNKWGIEVKIYLPSDLKKIYIAFVDAKDGRFKGIFPKGKTDITSEWKDTEVIKPFDLQALEESRKHGQKDFKNSYSPFFQGQP